MPRKLRPAPEMPEDPIERLNEVVRFRKLLADKFYDYDYRDVYESVFRNRVDVLLENINFDPEKMSEEEKQGLTEKQKVLSMKIFKIGKEIQETDSTEVKLYILFFKTIEEFFH
jgi:hypothetical protein